MVTRNYLISEASFVELAQRHKDGNLDAHEFRCELILKLAQLSLSERNPGFDDWIIRELTTAMLTHKFVDPSLTRTVSMDDI